jgi:hypothetical protein
MSDWKINESQAQQIIDTTPVKLPISAERKLEIEFAREILRKWKEESNDTRK